jgi:hypothetical protein
MRYGEGGLPYIYSYEGCVSVCLCVCVRERERERMREIEYSWWGEEVRQTVAARGTIELSQEEEGGRRGVRWRRREKQREMLPQFLTI